MSRWSEEFEKHPVHETIQQLNSWLDVESKNIDEAQQVEFLRLRRVLDTISDVVDSLNPQFYPEPSLTQIYNELRHSNVWSQIESYSVKPELQPLVVANNHLTNQATAVHTLAALSAHPESRKAIRATERAFEKFVKLADEKEEILEQDFNNFKLKISEADEHARRLSSELDEIRSGASTAINNWQTEFTAAQTERATEHSNDQIKRNKEFEGTLSSIATNNEKKFAAEYKKIQAAGETALRDYQKEINSRSSDAKAMHESLREIYELVANDAIAGGYKKSAQNEKQQADRWRWIAMGSLGLAAVWTLVKFFHFGNDASGELNWAGIVTASSLTLILILAAGYASRQSKSHRDSEQQLRWFALEVKAIDPFLSSLPAETQNDLKKQLSERLFGQNRVSVEKSEIDPSTIKSLTDGYLSPFVELVKLIRK